MAVRFPSVLESSQVSDACTPPLFFMPPGLLSYDERHNALLLDAFMLAIMACQGLDLSTRCIFRKGLGIDMPWTALCNGRDKG